MKSLYLQQRQSLPLEVKIEMTNRRIIEWYDPDPRGMDAIGGLDLLKEWLNIRRKGFSKAAREFGLPAPKGVLLVGVPGCGFFVFRCNQLVSFANIFGGYQFPP